LTSAVVTGEGHLADVAGRRVGARRGTSSLLLALAIALGLAVTGGVLAGLDENPTHPAVEMAQSENRALRARQEILREQIAALEGRLAESVERGRRLRVGDHAAR
jgi:hypothetical protein